MVTSYVIYLMMDHNGIDYYRTLVIVNKLRLRMCCCGLIPVIKQYGNSPAVNIQQDDNDKEKTEVTTETKGVPEIMARI